ncbi:hypothetical protein EBQ93_00350, partial [bacterium]|nr:hypothetical protein [bacterium]
ERLDVTTNKLEFSRIEAVGASFNRLRRATTSYAEASATAFTELQAGFNNFRADFLGGLATLVQYSGSLYADTTKPLAVLLEVTGRVVNILLRAAGAVVKFASAFSIFPAVARFAQAVGEKIKEVLEVLEEGVSKADEFANAVYNALTPDYWTGAIEGGKNLNQQILATAQTLGLTIVSAGAAKAAMELAGIQPGRAFRALAAMIRLPELSFRGLATAAISAFRTLTVGITQTLINYTAAAIKIIAVNAQMGVAAIIKWITPSLSGMISYVTGIRAVEVATRIMAVRMAASWVIASAGLALIPILAVAVYENFDRLSSYFASFASNVAKLSRLREQPTPPRPWQGPSGTPSRVSCRTLEALSARLFGRLSRSLRASSRPRKLTRQGPR